MASTIQFRFNSSKRNDAVTFSGMMIKLLELKRAIVEKKQLARGHLDFDLHVSNAQTNEGARPLFYDAPFLKRPSC